MNVLRSFNSWFELSLTDIKQFQSDWGGEYRAFTSVLARNRIVHCVTCPRTLEQSGVAERKHRHIVEVGLTLLAQANLSMKFWGFTFNCAVHLINRLPTPVFRWITPFMMLHGKEQSYDHLRVFGCCCFLYLCPFQNHKLDFQSQLCKFLRYSSSHKGYQCLTPDDRLIISRHVIFDENRFLFRDRLIEPRVSNECVPTYFPIVQPGSSSTSRSVIPTGVVHSTVAPSTSVPPRFGAVLPIVVVSGVPVPDTTVVPAATTVPDAVEASLSSSNLDASADTLIVVSFPLPIENLHPMVF